MLVSKVFGVSISFKGKGHSFCTRFMYHVSSFFRSQIAIITCLIIITTIFIHDEIGSVTTCSIVTIFICRRSINSCRQEFLISRSFVAFAGGFVCCAWNQEVLSCIMTADLMSCNEGLTDICTIDANGPFSIAFTALQIAQPRIA